MVIELAVHLVETPPNLTIWKILRKGISRPVGAISYPLAIFVYPNSF